MEQKKVKKKAGLFRSVSSLSTSSRRNDGEKSDEKKSALERIRLSVGRRSVEDFSNHPISEIWNENENRQSPTNILEPVFEDVPVQPSAPAFHEESSPTAPSFIFNSTLDRQNLPQINEINLPVNLDEPQSSQSITNIFPGVTENTGATSAAEVSNQYSENEEIQCDTKEEEEIIEMLKASPSSSTSPYKSNDTTKTTKKFTKSDEPFLFGHLPENSASTSGVTSPQKIPRAATSDQDAKCVICLEGAKDIVFQPCWHQVTCPDCAVRIKECPLCREVIAVRRRPYRC